ncbi:hypothetical protein HMPREF9727_01804 [Treponema denticola MYR-T]|uniref:Uncharacterized protein n=1 Tax=Treponema denticola H1-T TaxID=999431 RepID=M2BW62_TREDN|nr:hypothetical protein HMPREF9727_01804 [Treponema denticola MYR-T]EMB29287.1 hypothetical protein HMPREF9725_02157 [Treponema denticola H1-T]EMB39598.1 hypothetical protein HMPREF9722_01957 [Treponema denticola ATCC 33520]
MKLDVLKEKIADSGLIIAQSTDYCPMGICLIQCEKCSTSCESGCSGQGCVSCSAESCSGGCYKSCPSGCAKYSCSSCSHVCASNSSIGVIIPLGG